MIPLLLAASLFATGDPPAASADEILLHVRFLASDELEGRRSGTPAANRAARYLATRFRALGLEPAGVDGGWFQPFEVHVEAKAGGGSAVHAKAGSGAVAPLPGKSGPLPLSASAEADGDLLFAGYGITDADAGYDDYAGVDATGRIVLVLRHGPGMSGPEDPHAPVSGTSLREKVLNAKHHGAAGLLLANGWSPAASADDAFAPFEGGASDSGIPALQIANEGALALASGADFDLKGTQAAIDADRKPGSAPLAGVRVAMRAEVIRTKGTTRNVLGLLRGSDASAGAGAVVVGAHYDHLGWGGEGSRDPRVHAIHNGADDNASGTAALVEIARLLAAGPRPARSVVFAAFSGEEEGLLGSAKFVETQPVPAGPIVAMLNLDMVGRYRPDSLRVIGVGTSPRWKGALDAAKEGLELSFEASEGTRSPFGGSDHQSFSERGIPVLFFFTGTHDDYHRPTDDAEKVNAPDAARIATLGARAIGAIAATAEPVPYTKPNEPKAMGGDGGPIRAWLGTVPDYAETEKGVRLSGVSGGSPAEKAGLKRGDFVQRIGEVNVGNVYDLTYALGKYRPGDEVEVVIERDGTKQTIKVTLARRRGGA